MIDSFTEGDIAILDNEQGGRVTWRTNWNVVTLLAAVVLLHVPGEAAMQQRPVQPALPDVQKLGPQVGSRVPDFTLVDQRGQSRTLTSLIGPNGVMLVFFRSADW
jgi:hypothetical protein